MRLFHTSWIISMNCVKSYNQYNLPQHFLLQQTYKFSAWLSFNISLPLPSTHTINLLSINLPPPLLWWSAQGLAAESVFKLVPELFNIRGFAAGLTFNLFTCFTLPCISTANHCLHV